MIFPTYFFIWEFGEIAELRQQKFIHLSDCIRVDSRSSQARHCVMEAIEVMLH